MSLCWSEAGDQLEISYVSPECFVGSVLLGELQQLVSAHGYWAVALIVGLESVGLPLPGETILVLAAIYAATEPNFNVGVVNCGSRIRRDRRRQRRLLARAEIRLRHPAAIR